MSDGWILFWFVVGFLVIFLGVPLFLIFFWEIVYFFKEVVNLVNRAIKYPFVQYKKNKQMNCYHRWRKLDGDYSRTEIIYRYRCVRCKSEKKLPESESVRFEKDFMSDW